MLLLLDNFLILISMPMEMYCQEKGVMSSKMMCRGVVIPAEKLGCICWKLVQILLANLRLCFIGGRICNMTIGRLSAAAIKLFRMCHVATAFGEGEFASVSGAA